MWFAVVALALAAPLGDVSLSPRGLDADMEKLNEYIQADKLNEQSVEQLYADLSHRFNGLKAEMARNEQERGTANEALKSARAELEEAREEQQRLKNQLGECQKENSQMAQARASALHALGLDANATSESSV